MMIGPENAEISKSVLRCLAHHQGTCIDPFREEERGKILHEIRRGELSRSGTIPFGRYYGSVDSTPLFIMALGQYVRETGDLVLADELYEHWTQALAWLVTCQTKQGLVRFKPSGSGLTVQSWKDSHDSMNHADGTTAEAPLAVAEVQGYTFAAFMAASELFAAIGDHTNAKLNRERAGLLRENFHDLFWLSELNTYAMALDKNDVPLAVKSSDPGHLLWCGIVPEDIAPRLVATLLGPECWSGWGLRMLAPRRYATIPSPTITAVFGRMTQHCLAQVWHAMAFRRRFRPWQKPYLRSPLNCPGTPCRSLFVAFQESKIAHRFLILTHVHRKLGLQLDWCF